MLRNDFVSNSSSSSFIVISDKNIKKYDFKDEPPHALPNRLGNYEFGWSFIKYHDFYSKLNFCALQIHDINLQKKYIQTYDYSGIKDKISLDIIKKRHKHILEMVKEYDKCWDMLVKVCHDNFNLDIMLKTDDTIEHMWAYIDHQSSASEGCNMEMFESEDSLYNFLASVDSYVATGNDNSDEPDKYEEIYDGYYKN